MEKTIIKVSGMSCQGCVKNVTGVLLALEGVNQVEVSLEAAEARVGFMGDKLSRRELCAVIEDAGFDAE